MRTLAERVRIKLRIAQTNATARYSVGGALKRRQPRPITLPKLKDKRVGTNLKWGGAG